MRHVLSLLLFWTFRRRELIKPVLRRFSCPKIHVEVCHHWPRKTWSKTCTVSHDSFIFPFVHFLRFCSFSSLFSCCGHNRPNTGPSPYEEERGDLLQRYNAITPGEAGKLCWGVDSALFFFFFFFFIRLTAVYVFCCLSPVSRWEISLKKCSPTGWMRGRRDKF